jgi:hypothetical protein
MTVPIPFAALAIVPAGVVAAAPSGDDSDLDRIPDVAGVPAAATAAAARPARRRPQIHFYIEDAPTLAARRAPVVPFPPPPYRWQNRTSAELVADWAALRSFKLVLSDRLDLIAQEDVTWWSRTTVRNELREGYASWQPRARIYLEAGRINVRNGVALGFNPTDFFRPRTLVGQASLDPSVLSRNRLGTLMVRAQAIGERGAVSLLYAPKLFEPSPITGDAIGIDPRFDATNTAHRVLASASATAGDLSAQALFYYERRRSKVGLALTRPLGSSVVAYAEWALGYEANLITRAIDYGQDTGTLSPGLAPPIPTAPSLVLRNDVAAGASWTIGTRLTLNFEYHFHQGALTADDWTRWFVAGRANPLLAPELWYIRGYAADQMEPASQHNAFVRLAWPNALLDDLEVDAFAFVNLRDGSTLAQVAASYTMSDRWTFTLLGSANIGTPQSERGSLPQAANGIVEVDRYF